MHVEPGSKAGEVAKSIRGELEAGGNAEVVGGGSVSEANRDSSVIGEQGHVQIPRARLTCIVLAK